MHHTIAALLCSLTFFCACAAEAPAPGPGPGPGPAGSPDAGTAAAHQHGDVCLAPAYDCGGAATGLICVVDQAGDTQGTCRATCASFSDCLDRPDATQMFDTACCDIDNGTQVCGQTDDWPAGACD